MSKTSPLPPSSPSHHPLFRFALLALTAGTLASPQKQQAQSLYLRPARTTTMPGKSSPVQPPPASGYWHTQGNLILDQNGHEIRISGVNWSGFETKQAVVGGLGRQDYRRIILTIRESGFNTVRIPFSNEMVERPTVPNTIAFNNASGSINTDLRDLDSLEILDKIITYSGRIGLKVILDNHRSEAGSSAEENGLWYTEAYPEAAWIQDWKFLAKRYETNSTVIGMDLRNEPHNSASNGACWDCGGAHDWHLAATRAANAVLTTNPRLLIFVEGVDAYGSDTSWWGGNLEGVRHSPIHLSIPGRLVYSAHEYGPSEYNQPWFNGSTDFSTLTNLWHRRWAYISEAEIAPVWVGEFGTPNSAADIRSSQPGSEGQWFSAIVRFLNQRPAIGWTYWGVNGEDRYGLLDAAYSRSSSNALKMQALASIQSPTASTIPHAEPEAHEENAAAPAHVLHPQPRFPLAASTATTRPSTLLSTSKRQHLSVAASRSATLSHSLEADEDVQHAIAATVREATRLANGTGLDNVEEGDR